ncbi:MAG TPA: pseudouridine synthase [Gemmatimonadaceae bacterium]
MNEPMRLHRALARAGVASRRKIEQLIAEGRVRVNGAVAQIGQVVDPANDRVTVDGRVVPLASVPETWIVLHKPAGVMTTRADPQGRPTVFDLVEDVPGLVYVGRLDYDTEGVLLLTTDGRAAHRLTHPSTAVEREYVATVRGDAPGAVQRAREGVELHDGLVRPKRVEASPAGRDRWHLTVVITEGRKREVRRLCRALGLTVERLVRVRYGPVRLGRLGAGESRGLTPRERAALDALLEHA